MPGLGHRFTEEEDELAKKIIKEYERKGYSKEEAKRIAYSTINERRKKMKKGGGFVKGEVVPFGKSPRGFIEKNF